MKPLEEILPARERDELRNRAVYKKGFYSPWLHLGVTTVSGLSFLIVGILLIHDLKLWELGFGLVVFLVSNGTEWRIHRDLLHHRKKPMQMLYDAHTPMHHMVYITDDMAMRDRREFRLVLIPAYGIVGVAFMTLPFTAALWLSGQHNLTGVFLVVTMGYVVSYELLHLSYHLAEDSFFGRMALIRFLRKTHAVHHDPRLMQRWNFNVTLPLWDLVRGTYTRDREQALNAPRRAQGSRTT